MSMFPFIYDNPISIPAKNQPRMNMTTDCDGGHHALVGAGVDEASQNHGQRIKKIFGAKCKLLDQVGNHHRLRSSRRREGGRGWHIRLCTASLF